MSDPLDEFDALVEGMYAELDDFHERLDAFLARTFALAEVRRGTLTRTKREALSELADALRELSLQLDEGTSSDPAG